MNPLFKKSLTFARIQPNSFQTIKGESNYYKNLVEVTVKNDTYIYDLDEQGKSPKEVNFIEGIDQLTKLDTFVNTGTNQIIVSKKEYKQQGKPMQKTRRLCTNEQVSMYFEEIKE